MNWHINSDKTAAVSDGCFWLPIRTCPRDVKVLLLTTGGTAVLGQYYGQIGYDYWFPLPRKHAKVDRLLKEHQELMRRIDEFRED